MIENLPIYISITFALTTAMAFVFIMLSIKNSGSRKNIAIAMSLWLAVHALLTIKGVYNAETDLFPPKIMIFGIFPPIVTIIILFLSAQGRDFIDSLSIKTLTYLHLIRLPVEIVLFWLFLNKAVPELMTFEGRNFDIIAGITAPFIAYFGLTKKMLHRNVILIWNFVCLGLLTNIIFIALLSTPSPIQRFAFEQPNIAISNFPFSWLPTFVVPIVLFAHLASIRALLKQKTLI
ncbi:hypothetical protein [Pedobacter arcticus]|uniref:hypothetical protein n=1 Tax=Pedobacter arcticus TaxID=752140 RepID=UPI0002DF899B|nr:hypothetical protein [Pedobacter arcticus]